MVLFIGIYSYDIYDRMGGMADLNGHEAMHPNEQLASVRTSNQKDSERIWGGIAPTGNADVLPVEVTALQFAFIFHYPKQNITSGELHVPTGQMVELRMKANDVIHAFWVPQFRIKQDIIPGQTTMLSFTATKTGDYPIVCAELCGPYHGGMRSHVVVQDPGGFDAWIEKNSPPLFHDNRSTLCRAPRPTKAFNPQIGCATLVSASTIKLSAFNILFAVFFSILLVAPSPG